MEFEKIKKRLVNYTLFFRAASWITRRSPRIFMYHRFSPDASTRGKIDETTFKWQIEVLSKRWNVMTLGDYLGIVRKGESPPPYTVVLTIDDGYRDFYLYAYPWLKKYSLPATFFPTVYFINGKWLWWDRINYSLENTKKKDFSFVFSGKSFDLDMSTAKKKESSWLKLSDFCVDVDNDVKWVFISELEKGLEVKMPSSPPEEYMAVSWEELKELHGNGIEIGSHTLNHPIVSRISEETLKDELLISKARLEEFLDSEIISFCYPNGKPDDLNSAVCGQVEKAGYKGAVVSYNRISEFDPYRIPRMGVDTDRDEFLWKLSGMETLVLKLKSKTASANKK